EPFSYIVPHNSFGTVTELWDDRGAVVATLDTQALREGAQEPAPAAPAAGGPGGRATALPDTSRRAFAWHPAGGLTYLKTTVGEDRRANGVRWMHWKAPFGAADTALIFAGSARFTSAAFGS